MISYLYTPPDINLILAPYPGGYVVFPENFTHQYYAFSQDILSRIDSVYFALIISTPVQTERIGWVTFYKTINEKKARLVPPIKFYPDTSIIIKPAPFSEGLLLRHYGYIQFEAQISEI